MDLRYFPEGAIGEAFAMVMQDEFTESDSPADTSNPLYIQMTAKRRTRASPLVLNLINKLVLRVSLSCLWCFCMEKVNIKM